MFGSSPEAISTSSGINTPRARSRSKMTRPPVSGVASRGTIADCELTEEVIVRTVAQRIAAPQYGQRSISASNSWSGEIP